MANGHTDLEWLNRVVDERLYYLPETCARLAAALLTNLDVTSDIVLAEFSHFLSDEWRQRLKEKL